MNAFKLHSQKIIHKYVYDRVAVEYYSKYTFLRVFIPNFRESDRSIMCFYTVWALDSTAFWRGRLKES